MRLESRLKGYKSYIINLIVPAVVFGFITGTLTALVVTVYKACAHHVIHYSQLGYEFLREHLEYLPVVLLCLLGFSCLFAYIYRKIPNIKGGGIPTSVGILRGLIVFKWIRSLIGVFFLSLFSFLVGVPLGNEGPSVQMGTTIGRGAVYTFAKGKHRAWDRYTMTGGACAGFSVATGAPISGILFAIEEAHQRISPTIMIVASSSVLFANIASHAFAQVFGVSTSIFGEIEIPQLAIKQLWIPIVVGLVLGLLGAIILKYYQLLKKFFQKALKKVPTGLKIFSIFTLTVIVGIISFSGISTGHDLILDLFENKLTIGILIFILLARTTLTIGANTNGICGGMFIPSLAIGAVISAIVGKGLLACGVSEKYYGVILVLGMVATLSGLMKSPLTAIVFSIEALSCHENILPVIIVTLVAYFVTELFEAKSINDSAMESRIEEQNHGKEPVINQQFVKIKFGSFAVGKQVRDIFWPSNLFVLSVKKAKSENEELDGHGGKELRVGDILHVKYSTLDEETTLYELEGIVGEQTEEKIDPSV
ncbi:MAG: chloride channel protein [Clostridia bacterium]|nr:chloride channel protein [Clostridia bacterium]